MSTGQADKQDVQPKRRAACEECRSKKLKCNGEQPACGRCIKEHIDCIYSIQRPMGRPKKRRKSANGIEDTSPASLTTTMSHDHSLQRHTAQEEVALNLHKTNDATASMIYCEGTTLGPMSTMPWPMAGSLSPTYPLSALAIESSGSSALNLPSELTRTQSRHNSSKTTQSRHNSNEITQSLYGASTVSNTTMLPCACLSSMYLTLNALTAMDPAAPFPYALHPLREAMSSAYEILICKECPKQFLSGMQNTNAMTSLIMSITERYSRVLENISLEADRAQAAGEVKKFRLADLEAQGSHLHAGGLGCVAAFTIDLAPSDWRDMCKKVVRAEIYGPTDGNMCCPYLTGLMSQMEKRQEEWHSDNSHAACRAQFGETIANAVMSDKAGDKICLRMIAFSRKLLAGVDWS